MEQQPRDCGKMVVSVRKHLTLISLILPSVNVKANVMPKIEDNIF